MKLFCLMASHPSPRAASVDDTSAEASTSDEGNSDNSSDEDTSPHVLQHMTEDVLEVLLRAPYRAGAFGDALVIAPSAMRRFLTVDPLPKDIWERERILCIIAVKLEHWILISFHRANASCSIFDSLYDPSSAAVAQDAVVRMNCPFLQCSLQWHTKRQPDALASGHCVYLYLMYVAGLQPIPQLEHEELQRLRVFIHYLWKLTTNGSLFNDRLLAGSNDSSPLPLPVVPLSIADWQAEKSFSFNSLMWALCLLREEAPRAFDKVKFFFPPATSEILKGNTEALSNIDDFTKLIFIHVAVPGYLIVVYFHLTKRGFGVTAFTNEADANGPGVRLVVQIRECVMFEVSCRWKRPFQAYSMRAGNCHLHTWSRLVFPHIRFALELGPYIQIGKAEANLKVNTLMNSLYSALFCKQSVSLVDRQPSYDSMEVPNEIDFSIPEGMFPALHTHSAREPKPHQTDLWFVHDTNVRITQPDQLSNVPPDYDFLFQWHWPPESNLLTASPLLGVCFIPVDVRSHQIFCTFRFNFIKTEVSLGIAIRWRPNPTAPFSVALGTDVDAITPAHSGHDLLREVKIFSQRWEKAPKYFHEIGHMPSIEAKGGANLPPFSS